MRILNAIDAVSPAVARTRLVLFTPFRWGRSWKLAATAYLSFAGLAFAPFSLLYSAGAPILNEKVSHKAAVVLVAFSLAFTAVYTVVFLLCSRLQFAFFDITLNRGEFVAPAWRKYGAVSRPWTLLKLAVGLVLTAALIGPCIAWVRTLTGIVLTFPQQMQATHSNPMPPQQVFSFMAAFYGFYFAALAVLGLYYLTMSTLSSFMVPSMALEGMSPRAAFKRFATFVRREPGALLGFIGLRVVMALAAYFGVTIVVEFALLLVLAVVGGLALLAGLVLHSVGVPTVFLDVVGVVLGVLFLLFVWGYGLVLAMGVYFTFFEAHTLYFLGGRYPMLGELLERSTPPPAAYAYPQSAFAPPYAPISPSPGAPEAASRNEPPSQS